MSGSASEVCQAVRDGEACSRLPSLWLLDDDMKHRWVCATCYRVFHAEPHRIKWRSDNPAPNSGERR